MNIAQRKKTFTQWEVFHTIQYKYLFVTANEVSISRITVRALFGI